MMGKRVAAMLVLVVSVLLAGVLAPASAQDQYAVLSPNERVTIIGVITDGSRRVTGMSILRGGDAQAP